MAAKLQAAETGMCYRKTHKLIRDTHTSSAMLPSASMPIGEGNSGIMNLLATLVCNALGSGSPMGGAPPLATSGPNPMLGLKNKRPAPPDMSLSPTIPIADAQAPAPSPDKVIRQQSVLLPDVPSGDLIQSNMFS